MASFRADSPAIIRTGLTIAVAISLTVVSFRGGGYERNVYLEMGVLAWLAIVVTGLARPQALGILASSRVVRVMAILAALVALSGLAMIWSDSPERSSLEALRAAGLLAVLAIGVLISRRAGPETIVVGVAAAAAIVAGAAVGSRVLFDLFPANEVAEFLPSFKNRLSYPLTYWNALAALMAIGLPLVMHLIAASRSTVVVALASASAPLIGLALFLTLSRGGILAAVSGLALTFVLSPVRARFIVATSLTLLLTAGLSVMAALQDDLFDGLTTPTAETQGIELLLVVLAAMLVAASAMPATVERGGTALRSFASSAPSRGSWRRALSNRKRASALTGLVIATSALALLVSGVGSQIVEDFTADEFEGNTAGASRLTSINSSTRSEYWASAIDAGFEHPLLGIGPGTWEFWWAEDGETGPFARDAHSLYLEAFAELGAAGFLLVVALLVAVLAAGVVSSRQEEESRLRSSYAALTGAALAFAIAAAVDWAWEVTVLPMAFVLVAAPLLSSGEPRISGGGLRARILVGLVGGAVLIALLSSVRSEWQISSSQNAAARGDLNSALESARSATTLRRYAATPFLQRALVEEALGRFEEAAVSARMAAEREPTNWRHQLVLSRIEEAAGNLESARQAFDRGQELNPRSPAFAISNRP